MKGRTFTPTEKDLPAIHRSIHSGKYFAADIVKMHGLTQHWLDKELNRLGILKEELRDKAYRYKTLQTCKQKIGDDLRMVERKIRERKITLHDLEKNYHLSHKMVTQFLDWHMDIDRKTYKKETSHLRSALKQNGTYEKASAAVYSRIPDSLTGDGMSLSWLTKVWHTEHHQAA